MILMDYSQQYALALMDMQLDTFWCKSREQEYVVKNTESNIQHIVIINTIVAGTLTINDKSYIVLEGQEL